MAESTVDFALVTESELVPVTVTMALVDQDRQQFSRTFHENVTVASVFRLAVHSLHIDTTSLSQQLLFTDPLGNIIEDPTIVTLQQTIDNLGIRDKMPEGMTSYEFVLKDGDAMVIKYSGKYGEGLTCAIRLRDEKMTLEDVLFESVEKMNIPKEVQQELNDSETLEDMPFFVSTASGIALLDLESQVDSFHLAEGLCICDREDLLQVTVNEKFVVGFTKRSRPTAAVLLSTMGQSLEAKIAKQYVVLPDDMPLENDGSYAVVSFPGSVFHEISLKVPDESNSSVTLTILEDCPVSRMIEEGLASMSEEQRKDMTPENTVIVDGTGCIVDFDLEYYQMPSRDLSFQVI